MTDSTRAGAPRLAARERATHNAQRATLVGILSLITLLSLGRLLITAFGYGVPAWFDEELNPLLNLLVNHQPIIQIDARQYGVVVFLVFDPALRVVGANLAALATYATWVALVATLVAFILMARRFAPQPGARLLILAIAWSSAVPLLYVVAQHMVDAWQLLFLSASLFLFTGTGRQRQLAAVPVAAATLTKLLPALLLVYFAARSWRLAALGVVALGALLALGHVLYGPLMGLGYPLAMLTGGGDTIARWSTHFENNSIRGLVFKLGAGFHLQGDTSVYILDPARVPFLNIASYSL
ncbi:MAG TPA: glycosyltransferase 87 family protein, partial [Chloroflexota bacterium]|nr:glycosyltransferase 87 family protein [Chloroflexota bacterium]